MGMLNRLTLKICGVCPKIVVLFYGNRLRTIITGRNIDVTHADRTSTSISIYLEEKDLSDSERKDRHFQSKGFYPPSSIHDFPLRGKSLILHVRRRRWQDMETGNPFLRDWEVVVKGTRLTEEFASFLKGTPG